MAKDAYRYFRVEARDLLNQLGRGILDLEKGSDTAIPALVSRLLRLAHTLKGAARVVKQAEIAEWAHAIEDTLAPWREGPAGAPRECVEQVLSRIDQISAQLATLSPVTGPGPSGPALPLAEETLRTLRTSVAEMDALLDGVAQTHAQIVGLRRRAELATDAGARLRRLVVRLPVQRAADLADPVTSRPKHWASELQVLADGLDQGLVGSVDQIDRELRQLRDAAEQLRLVPAEALFGDLHRSVRDAARTLNKQVRFEGVGSEVRLDAQVLGAVQPALLQVVRNAVAHGIETVEARQSAGKPVEGRITLSVSRRGRAVVFRCVDDGAGIDLDAVRRAAQRKGLVASDNEPTEIALLELLQRGGLSTAMAVTEVAGRGVGLDIVREASERLGGEVSLHTRPGQGTTLELRVPLSLAALDALVVEAAGETLSIPLDTVRRTRRLAPQDIARGADGDTIVHEGRGIPCVALARLLDEPAPEGAPRPGPVIVVESAGTSAGIVVDRLLGPAKLVLRPLPDLAPPSPLIAGVTLDVEGSPQLVLDAGALVQAAQRAGAPPLPGKRQPAPVLVVDDSLTTRMLEQSILESAGYAVHTVMSGEAALEQARRQDYSLFLVDVEMPGMDGFTFIERARADPGLRDVPAMLVTSRSSAQDLQRGREVGAQAYVVKSEFSQAEFLDRVRQLVQMP